MASKSESAMARVIDALLAAGFEPDGRTRTLVVRVPTAGAPVYGRSGGELAKLGGRQRFVRAGTNIKATVGPRTTAIYSIDDHGSDCARGIATHATSDSDEIAATLETLTR